MERKTREWKMGRYACAKPSEKRIQGKTPIAANAMPNKKKAR